ncbi:MAG: hypothetical protein BAJATHORv1_50120 [Candidatus Thorarchaeota archaeon]|nr:MAG: hypothetical protein BAJATHORv1_50120 [Candidatus Thorarchaeota archaeon]
MVSPTVKNCSIEKIKSSLRLVGKENIISQNNVFSEFPCITDNESIQMISYLEHLDWDSTFFEFECYHVKPIRLARKVFNDKKIGVMVKKSMSILKDTSATFVSSRLSLNDDDWIRQLEANGFQSYDWSCTLRASHSTLIPREDGILKKVRSAEESDIWNLMEISAIAFYRDRFHTDKQFGKQRADAMHAIWIKNLFYSDNSRVYVIEEGNQIGGYITLHEKFGSNQSEEKDELRIGLIAVHPKYSRRGLGGALLDKAISDVIDEHRTLSVGTQLNNTAAMRLYQKRGLKPSDYQTTLHYWFKSPTKLA